MPITRRPQGPRPFDRVLQVLGLGLQGFSTVKGIQQRQQQIEGTEALRALSERG